MMSVKGAIFLDVMLCTLSARYHFLEESVASICRVEEHGSTLKLEAVGSFKTSVPIYQLSQHHIMEDGNFCLVFSSE